MKTLWIIGTALVPALDQVSDDRCFFQSHSAKQRIHFTSCIGVSQAFIGNRSHDLMPDRTICLKRSCKLCREKDRQQETGAVFGLHFEIAEANAVSASVALELESQRRNLVDGQPRRQTKHQATGYLGHDCVGLSLNCVCKNFLEAPLKFGEM